MASITPKHYAFISRLFNKYPYLELRHKTPSPLLNLHITYPDIWNEWDDCKKAYNSIIQRRKRIRRYIRSMFNRCYLDTPVLFSLTFTDDILAHTNEATRKKYVQEYLHEICTDYFACIDFGKKNGREHYHAICLLKWSVPFITVTFKRIKFIQLNPALNWPFGFYSIRRIDTSFNGVERSTAYAFKTSNYAFKSASTTVKPFHKRGNPWLECEEGFF